MKIAIDAKWYFEGPPSGRLVIRNIVENIIINNQEDEIYIILKKSDKSRTLPFLNERVRLIFVWGNNNLISNLLFVPFAISKYKIDVCVFQFFCSIFGNFKKIVYIHDVIFKTHPEYFGLKERIYFLPMKFLARRSDGIITVSKYVQDRIKEYKFIGKEKKSYVVYNGVSTNYKKKEFFSSTELGQIKAKYGLPPKFLLYVGRLNERKNILNLLKSLNYIDDNDIKLVLCGKYDWKMFDVNKKINEMNLNNRVKLIGYVSDDELPLLYSLASVFCYVSFEEGFGLPPLEAMSSGVPVVVSNSSSLPEVCGDAGYYVDPYSPKDIAEKITLALKDKDLRKEKIASGLERVKKFTWQNSFDRIVKICKEVVDENIC